MSLIIKWPWESNISYKLDLVEKLIRLHPDQGITVEYVPDPNPNKWDG